MIKTSTLKKSSVQYFKSCFCFFYICRFFSIFYVHREKKIIFGYRNLQACTVVYATVKYLLYHLYIAKMTQGIEKYSNK